MTARSLGAARAVGAALIASACLAAGAASALAAPPTPQVTSAQQIAFLNAQRAAHGLPAGITEVPAWSDGCQKHMAYLDANPSVGLVHDEVVGNPGYTVEGDKSGNGSVLVQPGDAFSTTGRNAFEAAPIHLMQMLSPFVQSSGAWGGCFNTQGWEGDPTPRRSIPQPTTYTYPGDGKTVPTSSSSFEGPFVPAASVGLNVPGDITRSSGTGPHLYFFYAGPAGDWNSRGTITAASLTGSAGPVDLNWVDNDTPAPAGSPGATPLGLYLSPGGILIPVKPLANDATFTASVTFKPRGAAPAVLRTWSVKTGSGAAQPGSQPTPLPGGSAPVGETTVTPTTTPSTSQPLPPMDPSIAAGFTQVPKPTKVRLRARELSFVAPLTGKVRVTVYRETKSKKGKTKSVQVLRKTVTITLGKTVKLRTSKKVPKGTWTVQLATPGKGFASEVSATRS